jgi:hypothetical protein
MSDCRRVRCRKATIAVAAVIVLLVLGWKAAILCNWNPRYRVGQEIDRLNGVPVYFNGGVGHTSGRRLTPEGYNIGLKYQCVEFVKRYYYERFGHEMPDSYGHAKGFFRADLEDGALNVQRNLLQFGNGGAMRPRPDDLLVFGPSLFNRYGHVAIISTVTDSSIEIVQQNPGPFGSSRETISLESMNGGWRVDDKRILGWLRRQSDRKEGFAASVPCG